jgi:hypothetical protein
MTRAPQLAPSWLPRQQRRRVDRELSKLVRRNVCSICGSPLKHNHCTALGFEAEGNVAVAGECCFDRLALVFARGFYSDRHYDFLTPRIPAADGAKELTNEQVARAIAAYQKTITDIDRRIDDIVRRGGGVCVPPRVYLFNHPWKDDDRNWFKQNPSRSHRVRMPFPNEADEAVADPPAEHALIMLVRQVEPGSRLRFGFYLNADLLPVPDDEAVAHALFEVAAGREAVPPGGAGRRALIEKYTAHRESKEE